MPEKPSALNALWRGLCPRCRAGAIFARGGRMHQECPVCNLRFEREHGYFTGAMYVSYGIGIPFICLFTLLAWLVFPRWQIWQLVLLAWLVFLPLVPWVYRYSRIAWIHLDRALDREGD